MKHILIRPSGKVQVFFVRQIAELYQLIYGGTLVGEFHEAEITKTELSGPPSDEEDWFRKTSEQET